MALDLRTRDQSQRGDVAEFVRGAHGRGADVAVERSAPRTIQTAIAALRKGGALTWWVTLRQDRVTAASRRYRQLVCSAPARHRANIQLASTYWARGAIRVEPRISAVPVSEGPAGSSACTPASRG